MSVVKDSQKQTLSRRHYKISGRDIGKERKKKGRKKQSRGKTAPLRLIAVDQPAGRAGHNIFLAGQKTLLGRRPRTTDGSNGRKFDIISPPDRLQRNGKKTPPSIAQMRDERSNRSRGLKPTVAAQPVSANRQERLGISILPSRAIGASGKPDRTWVLF